MKGPSWNRSEKERKQDEWKEHFIEEFGWDAYAFLKRVHPVVDVLVFEPAETVDAEVVGD